MFDICKRLAAIFWGEMEEKRMGWVRGEVVGGNRKRGGRENFPQDVK